MPLYVTPEEAARLKNHLATAKKLSVGNTRKKGYKIDDEKKERIIQLYKDYPSYRYVTKNTPASVDTVKAVLKDAGLIS